MTRMVGVLLLTASSASAEIIVVNSLDGGYADEPGECTLRSAIVSATDDVADGGCLAGNGTDTIEIAVEGRIDLDSRLPTLFEQTHIQGPGRHALTLDANQRDKILVFGLGHSGSSLRGLTLQDGYTTSDGGCLAVFSDAFVLEDVIFEGCVAEGDGGGALLVQSDGALIRRVEFGGNHASDSGALALSGLDTEVAFSTFYENTATGSGGAMKLSTVFATGKIDHCTFLQNQADLFGGALELRDGAEIQITNSTFHLNSALAGGGAISTSGAPSALGNSIVAGNKSKAIAPDVYPEGGGAVSSFTTLGSNLIGDNEAAASIFPVGAPNANGDRVGSSQAPLEPLFALGTSNGGPTPTLVPTSEDHVIDKGSCSGQATDQRGFGNPATGLRPIDGPAVNTLSACDIGAVEVGAVDLTAIFADGFESGDTDAWQ